MDYKKGIILIFFILNNVIFSQNIKITALSKKAGVINVKIKNISDKQTQIFLDESGLNYGCSRDDLYSEYFLRMSICATIPKNKDFPIGVILDQHPTKNSSDLEEAYKLNSTVLLKPFEEKKITYNLYVQKESFKKRSEYPTTIKAKLVFYNFDKNNKIVTYIYSDVFKMKVHLRK